jgi:hypothetical protein
MAPADVPPISGELVSVIIPPATLGLRYHP